MKLPDQPRGGVGGCGGGGRGGGDGGAGRVKTCQISGGDHIFLALQGDLQQQHTWFSSTSIGLGMPSFVVDN